MPQKANKKILFILFDRLIDGNKDKGCRNDKHNDDRPVNSYGIYQYYVTKRRPKQNDANNL